MNGIPRYSTRLLVLFLPALLACSRSKSSADLPSIADPGPAGNAAIAELVNAVDGARYKADLDFISKPRPPGSAHWKAVQDRCASRFSELGYTVELHAYETGVNVLGVKAGAGRAGEQVVVSAHYDHIANCDGADDNGTGVAGLLETAGVLSKARFDRTLVLACWDQEEYGYKGSKAWTERAKDRGDTVVGSFVYEMIGYRDTAENSQELPLGIGLLFPDGVTQVEAAGSKGDFLAIVTDDLSKSQADRVVAWGSTIGLPVLVMELGPDLKNNTLTGALRYSDHRNFWALDMPAMMLTDTSFYRNHHYHCKDGSDSVDTLDTDFATAVIRATVGAVAETLGVLP